MVAMLRRAQQQYPADFWVNHTLALNLYFNVKPCPLEEAIGYLRVAVALRPQTALPHLSLGNALNYKGQLDEAIAEYRAAIQLGKDCGELHINIGDALEQKGQLDEAIAECREAIRLQKDYNPGSNLPLAHYKLGIYLMKKGRLDDAITEYREAIRLAKDFLLAHNNLGYALGKKGQLDEAITECEETIRLNKNMPQGHYSLGFCLMKRGMFRQAAEEFRLGHELASNYPYWAGADQTADGAERLSLALMCHECKQLHTAAARFYEDAFTEQPRLADDLAANHRYNAACAAATAGCGQGADADKLDSKERARLRQRALDWLRADVKGYGQVMQKSPDKDGPAIAQRMQHWLQDEDFAGVRGDKALAKLSEAERKDWQKLWQEVETLRQRAAGQPK
jgi:tetratricopeptide (TPR) repeat protein